MTDQQEPKGGATSADVVIVGGGCMGASVAYHLAQRGVTDVLLVEREAQLGTGSTGRNAGGVRHQFSDPLNIALSKESIACFARFEEETGTAIDFWQDGYLFLLSSPESVAHFEASVALQRSQGIVVDWLQPAEIPRFAPGVATDGVLAATFCAADGVADPNGVTMGFAKAAQARGARVWRDAEVIGIDVAEGRVRGVETSRGRVATRTVIDAAGAWGGAVAALAGVAVPIAAERRHIFIARPGNDGSWDDERHRGTVPANRILVIDFASTFYFHREGPGVLLGMADPREGPGFDLTVRWDFLPEVIDAATRRLPALATGVISHAWAGLYEMTPDHNPIVGPTSVDGFWVIAGFSGHGFQHSPAAGRLLADLVTGRDPGVDLAPFALARFTAGGPARGELNVV